MSGYIPFKEIPSHLPLVSGDSVLIGSDVLSLAVAAQAHGEMFDVQEFLEAIYRQISPRGEGTLLLPGFNFDFCSGGGFHYQKSAPQTGALSRAAWQSASGFIRTQHPIHSFFVKGKDAAMLAERNNKSSFGSNSPFEYLHKKPAKMLLIGVGYQGAFTFAHYVEEIEQADYRYAKTFHNQYTDEAGKTSQREYSMYVRDLEKGVESDLDPIGESLDWFAAQKMINDTTFRVLSLDKAYQVIAQDIQENGGKKLYRIAEKSR